MNIHKAITVISIFLLVSGCVRKPEEELSRQELFSLSIGKMDNQLDLFQIKGERFGYKNRIFMRDGLFYIANGNSDKLMGLSSYGDLIFLLYNEESNPHPVSFNTRSSDNMAATRKAVVYPFSSIGEIVVDSEKRIFIEDTVPAEREVNDKELGVVLNRIILLFNRHGKLLNFIGQEGIGGTPFPYIDRVYISDNDELIVICRVPQAWLIFWFDSDGHLKYQVGIDREHLPAHKSKKKAIPIVAGIMPDLNKHFLYLYLYYYIDKMDTIDETDSLTDKKKDYSSRIYGLNLDTQKYEYFLDIPQNGYRKERIGTQEIEIPSPSYELIGVCSEGAFFLIRREDANLFKLLILNKTGNVLAKRNIIMEDSELYFKQIELSASGILYALLCEEYRVKIVWWRADKLLRVE